MERSYRFKPAELGIFKNQSDKVAALIEQNNRIIGLTNGEFSLIDLIHSILNKIGESHVIIATWSAGIKDVHQVEWMQRQNKIKTIRILLDHSYVNRQKKYAQSVTDLFGPENIRTSEMHAKFVLIHNECFKIAIRTSMNLNANKTCETFEIDNDVEIFDFYMNFVEHTFDSMPKGLTSESFKANKSLSLFFNKTNNNSWSEI